MTIRLPLRVIFKLRAAARRRRMPPSSLAAEILEQHFAVAGPCASGRWEASDEELERAVAQFDQAIAQATASVARADELLEETAEERESDALEFCRDY
jgi:hypothetical protein